jgi:hypothetical protein
VAFAPRFDWQNKPSHATPLKAEDLLRYENGIAAAARTWQPGEVLTAGEVRVAPDGHVITRNANGTARGSYDATEQALWTVVGGGGGGAVSSVAGRTGAVTLASTDLTDSTTTGRSLVTAASSSAARTALGVSVSPTTVVTPSGDTTGATDAAAINAALNTARLAGGGVVKLVGGQTYYFNDRLVVGSYSTLDATGAWVRQVDNTNKRQTTNYSWVNPVGTATDAAITSGASIITSPTLAPLAAVGQSITVAGAAGPSAAAVTFCGFVSAVNTGTNQITVTNLDGTTLTAGNTVSAATAVLYNRDIKPRVIGGFWDRGANNHLGFASDQSIHSFHHCDYPYVHPEGVYSQAGSDSGHCIDFADVTRCFGQIDHCNHQGVAVQLTGPVYGATIPRIVGTLFDDAFAITASDWATNQIETSGNVVGVWVGHIDVTSNMRLVNIIAGVGNLVDEVVIDEVHGTGSNSIGVVNIGDDVASASTVGGTYGSIEIRKIAARPRAGSRCVNLISPSFKKIKLGLDYTPWTYSALKTFVEMTGTSAVFPQQLEITGYAELSSGQTVVNVFSENSTSVQLDHLVIHDLVYDCNSSTGNLVALQTSNRVNNIDIHRVRMNSGSASFANTLVSLGTSANCGNLRIIGGLAWQVQKIISDTSTVASNITIGGGFLAQGPSFVYWGSPASAASTKTITLAGCVLNSVGTAGFFTTNVPLTFRWSPPGRSRCCPAAAPRS